MITRYKWSRFNIATLSVNIGNSFVPFSWATFDGDARDAGSMIWRIQCVPNSADFSVLEIPWNQVLRWFSHGRILPLGFQRFPIAMFDFQWMSSMQICIRKTGFDLIRIFLDEVNAIKCPVMFWNLESLWWLDQPNYETFYCDWDPPRSSGMPSWEIELHELRMWWDERWFHGVLLLRAMAAGHGPVAPAIETELVGTAASWISQFSWAQE